MFRGKIMKRNTKRLAAALIVLMLLAAQTVSGANTQGTGVGRTAIRKVSKISVSKKKIAVDVGFYIKGSPGSRLSASQIRKQLKAVKKFAGTVRFYGSAGELTKAYKIARKMKFKIIGTAWLCGRKSQDKKELNALIRLCKKKYVDVACVGSETMYRGDLTPEKLIGYLKQARKKISRKIPVTTAEDCSQILAHPEVGKYCDLLMVNAYPYWGGVAVSDAVSAFDRTIAGVREKFPGKELIVSETGWPTAGGRQRDAVAGTSQARQYFTGIRKWSKANNIVVLWFDAADEPWKASAEGKAGAHWGLMTKKCKIKSCYKGLL